MSEVTIGELCMGYGGLGMGLSLALGGDTRVAWAVEYDKHPSAIIAHRYPGVTNYGDVKTTDWTKLEPVDWLTAGYPCQPFSLAGLRKGVDDPRHLWPGVARAISVLRPRNVLLENVAAHLRDGFDTVLADLAAMGYDARWGVVRASDAGAPHGRARLFVVAHPAGDQGRQRNGDDVPARVGWGNPRTEPGDANSVARSPRGSLQGRPSPLGEPCEVERAERSDRAHSAADTEDDRRQRGVAGGREPQQSGPAGYLFTSPDPQGNGWGEGWTESARVVGRPDAALSSLSFAPDADDAAFHGERPREEPREGGSATPDADSTGCEAQQRRQGARDAGRLQSVDGGDPSRDVQWGAYGAAIARWERVIGRPAPRPTEPGRNGERLSPRFVEFLMGLPDGWVTDVPGLPRNAMLKALGNGVVPQQAALACRLLGVAPAVMAA